MVVGIDTIDPPYYYCRHVHGSSQGPRTHAGVVDCHECTAAHRRAPVLSAAESRPRRPRVRRVCRSAMRVVLRGHARTTESHPRHLFSPAVDRLLRRHRFGTRHRVADGRLARAARVLGLAWTKHARALDDLADSSADRPGDPRGVHVDPAGLATANLVKGRRSGSMPPRSRPTRLCGASCGATRAKPIRSF